MVMKKKLCWESGGLGPKFCPDTNQLRAPGMSLPSVDYRSMLQGAGSSVTWKSRCSGQADMFHPSSAPWTSYLNLDKLFKFLTCKTYFEGVNED